MKRDLTQAQFEARATKLGFKKCGFMGYWSLASNPSLNISVLNAGPRRRERLKYLILRNKQEAMKLSEQASTQG